MEKSTLYIQSLTEEGMLKIRNIQEQTREDAQGFGGSGEELQELLDELKERGVEAQKLLETQRRSGNETHGLLEEVKEGLTGSREKTEELFRQSDEFVHKENVKVYRNVQAVVVEEAEKQAQALAEGNRQAAARNKKMMILHIATLVAVAGNLIMLAMQWMGV